MISKMNVDHWEWNALNDLGLKTLSQFKYIAIELHFIDESVSKETELYYNVLKKFQKLINLFISDVIF